MLKIKLKDLNSGFKSNTKSIEIINESELHRINGGKISACPKLKTCDNNGDSCPVLETCGTNCS